VLVLPDRSLVPIEEGVTLLGRHGGRGTAPPADVDLGPYDTERLVSRAHAELRFTGGLLSVRDLGSTNGTQVGGVTAVPGQDYPLRPGDEVAAGDVTLRVARLEERVAAEPLPEPPAARGDPVTRTLPETEPDDTAEDHRGDRRPPVPPPNATIVVRGRSRVAVEEAAEKKGGGIHWRRGRTER
jgi:hypothetical protein